MYASELFFCVTNMATGGSMYQYSLTYFISPFLHPIDASEHNYFPPSTNNWSLEFADNPSRCMHN